MANEEIAREWADLVKEKEEVEKMPAAKPDAKKEESSGEDFSDSNDQKPVPKAATHAAEKEEGSAEDSSDSDDEKPVPKAAKKEEKPAMKVVVESEPRRGQRKRMVKKVWGE